VCHLPYARRVALVSYASTPPGTPGTKSAPPQNQRGKILIPTVAVIFGLILILFIFTGFYTDFLWFKSMDMSSVFTRQVAIRAGLFFAFGVFMAAALAASMIIAYRFRPMARLRNAEEISLERYRAGVEPMRRALSFIVPIVLGLLAGISASSEWRIYSLWRNQQPFGATDAQFNTDIGFYMFTYPWLRFLMGFGFSIVLLSLIVGGIVHYLYGGIRLQPPAPRVSNAAQTHLSVLLGILCLLKAGSYWLDRYGLALKSEDLVQGFTGLKYRDINALLPAKSILIIIALICAVLFFVNAFRRSWQVAGAGLGLLVVSALVIGGVYPAIVQQFQVKPNEITREQEPIQRNIDATRTAYALNDVKISDYAASPVPDKAILQTQEGTLQDIRIVDPSVVAPTFRALQQIRSYYSFPDTLDIDRYLLNGKEEGSVVAARELNLGAVDPGQRNWANDHLVYTHGNGLVAAYDNQQVAGGAPKFYEVDVPPKGPLNITQPRIYFGENSPNYSIVGAPEGSAPQELDYTDDKAANKQQNNTYDGTGGVPVGSTWDRLLFSIKYQDPNIMLSSLINSESKIMWDRDPETVVSKVAPWLRLDSDPYPVVAGGRIKWIVDGYTTSNDYPYSSRVELADATSDSTVTKTPGAVIGKRDEINYIRNSVKAVVDAYDGSVNLYSWDDKDPILKTWEATFPGTVQPKSAMPADVLAHVRYPEDGFKVQRMIYARYHVTDPNAFYSGQDFWVVPTDPTKKTTTALQPPYYLSLQMPGEKQPAFSLTTAYAPNGRQTLAGFMAANSTPGANFGNFQVLQLPRNTTIPGPQQVQNNFESNPEVAERLSLLRRGGSEVDLGNLLSLPVGGGMLYVEPVYVRASEAGYPLLQKILVGFGDKVVLSNTLPEALAAVGVVPGAAPKPDGGKTPTPAPTGSILSQLAASLEATQKFYEEGQTALKAGNFAAYGEAQVKVEAELKKSQELQKQLAAQSTTAAAAVTSGLKPLVASIAAAE